MNKKVSRVIKEWKPLASLSVGVIAIIFFAQPAFPQSDSLSLGAFLQQQATAAGIRLFVRPEWVAGKQAAARQPMAGPLDAMREALLGTDLALLEYEPGLFVIAPLPGSFLLQSVRSFRAKARRGAIILGDSAQYVPEKAVQLSGRIIDFESGRPLPQARIAIKSAQAGAQTDEAGRFSLMLPSGIYDIDLEANGYATQKEQVVLWSQAHWEPTLSQAYYELPEVVLESGGADRNLSLPQLGYVRFDAQTIRDLPALLGQPDVVRAISFLPGVTSVGEGAPGFNVRGGSIDQTLVLQDGALLYNTGHVGGVFSVFNTEAVRSTVLMKGHMPAATGGRLGSALEVNTRNGDLTYWKGLAGIGVLSSQILLEGPLVPDKVSVLAAIRGGTPNHLLQFVKDLEVKNGSAWFTDGNLRLLARLGQKAELAIGSFGAADYLRFGQNYGFSWRSGAGYANLRVITGKAASVQVQASHSAYRAEGFDPSGFDAFSFTNGISNQRIRSVFRYGGWKGHDLSAGGELTHYQAAPEVRTPVGFLSRISPARVERGKGREAAIFLQDEFSIGPFFQISAGIRWSAYQQLGPDTLLVFAPDQPRTPGAILDAVPLGNGPVQTYQGWEPRLALSYRIDEKRSVKGGYNRTRQYIHLLSQTQAATPIDLWQPATHWLPPQIGNQWTMGYYQNFSQNLIETSAEFFYRTMQGLAEPKDLAQLLLNPLLETALLSVEGVAYGGEFLARKTRGDLTGWVSYAYTRAFRKANGAFPDEVISKGRWFPSAFDRPHQVNGVLNWRMIRRLSSSYTFTYQSGRPVSAAEAAYFLENSRLLNFDLRNNYRLPAYHRMDVSFTFEPQAILRQRYKSTYSFSIYNLYSRRNAFSLFYTIRPGERPTAYTLSILGAAIPSVSWNIRF